MGDASSPTRPARWAPSVLILDDEPAVRSFAGAVLERGGYTVLEAGSGAEAVRIFMDYRGNIDLLLADIILPGMAGHQVAQLLLRQQPRLKLIYMSGYSEGTLTARGWVGGSQPFLSKPFTGPEILEAVRGALG